MTQDIFRLTACEAADRIAAGALSPVAYAEALLERIAAREPEVQAFETLDTEGWLAAARAPVPGALSGVPFGAKDIIDSAGLPTRFGSPIHHSNVPQTDAACISALKIGGGILAGKMVTTEFANVTPGKTRNPHDSSRTPGGSSSGSAAAVAAGMIPLAIGTQTTSSTIRPAAYCGVWGYVPSAGELPLWGVRQSSSTLDRLGLFARSAEDIMLMRYQLQGRPRVTFEPAGGALRIGMCRTGLWDQVDGPGQALFEQSAEALSGAGHLVSDVELPSGIADLAATHREISSWEFVRNYAYEIDRFPDQISAALRQGRIADGLSCSWERYSAAIECARQAQGVFADFMQDWDLLICPAAAGEAPGSDTTGNFAFSAGWTLLHGPALALPCGTGPNGLPLSLQLVGPPRGDDRFVRVSAAISRVLDVRCTPV